MEKQRRRCIGCRKSDRKSELLRFVVSEGRIVCDVAQRLPGRGVYVHRSLSCWTKAHHTGARGERAARGALQQWSRALRIESGSPVAQRLSEQVVEAMTAARSELPEFVVGAVVDDVE